MVKLTDLCFKLSLSFSCFTVEVRYIVNVLSCSLSLSNVAPKNCEMYDTHETTFKCIHHSTSSKTIIHKETSHCCAIKTS